MLTYMVPIICAGIALTVVVVVSACILASRRNRQIEEHYGKR